MSQLIKKFKKTMQWYHPQDEQGHKKWLAFLMREEKRIATDIQELVSECLYEEWVERGHPRNFEAGKINLTLLDKKIKRYLLKEAKQDSSEKA